MAGWISLELTGSAEHCRGAMLFPGIGMDVVPGDIDIG